MTDIRKSYCRVCQAFCGYEVHVQGGKIARLRGDAHDPQSEGYACFKGLRHAELYDNPRRLKTAQKRVGNRFYPIGSDEALAAVGRQLRSIISEHGPGALGFFIGTQALFNTPAPAMIGALAAALPTPRVFTTMTIDQSAKWIAEGRLGAWEAGPQGFGEADVWMFVGSNPMVSMVAGAGSSQFAFTNPAKRMAAAKARGLKVIVIDPRVTETAQLADLHLQPRPGHDVMIAAALLNAILQNGWQDDAFCNEYVDQIDDLRAAVAALSPEAVGPIAGVRPSDIRAAARMFAREGRLGMVGTGTGPDMAAHSNTAEHLYQALNVLCGRFPRAGQRTASYRVLRPPARPSANVILAEREWESGPRSLLRRLGRIKGSMMSAEIPSEITHPSADRMRAMICVGGNMAVALPDQTAAEAALAQLELLVVIDPLVTATSRLAHYIIAPKLQYERADHTLYLEGMFQTPFAHVTAPVVAPPEGADVVDDWYALWRVAKELGVTPLFCGAPLSLDETPTTESLLALMAEGSAAPYHELVAREGAQLMEVEAPLIGPRSSPQRFQLLPRDVADELQAVCAQQPHRPVSATSLQLIVRRHKETMNSTGVALDATRKLYPGNPVYMHPDDLAARGLSAGQEVLVCRGAAQVGGLATPDPRMRPGVVAMSHGWSSGPGGPFVATNALVDADEGAQTINRMAVMTGIDVEIRPLSTI